MWNYNNELYHYGVKGMKWGKRKAKPEPENNPNRRTSKSNDIVIKKDSEIHRIIPKSWAEKEKNYKGHAYASYKKEDVETYKKYARLFGDGNNYVDMSFKVTKDLVSPSREKRVDNFVKLIDSDPKFRETMIKSTRNPLLFVPKKTFDNLDNEKKREKAYSKFAYLLVSKRDLRDPYFNKLREQGYNMIMDDADINGKISKAPIIVFDREKDLSLKKTKVIGRG